MRFLGPLPLTWARFTPSSRANLRTEGEACGRLRRGTSASAKDAVGDVRSGATDAMEDGAEAGAGAAAALGAASAGAGAGVGAGAAAAGAAAWGAPPVASTTRISAPWETLSPSLTLISLTTPPTEAGISMEALSDSTVIRLCSAWMVSPTLTRISMTSTASKSPMSGTTTGCSPPEVAGAAAAADAGAGAGAAVGAGAAAPAAAEADAAGPVAAPDASTSRMSAPSLTLSPSLTLTALTTPPCEAG